MLNCDRDCVCDGILLLFHFPFSSFYHTTSDQFTSHSLSQGRRHHSFSSSRYRTVDVVVYVDNGPTSLPSPIHSFKMTRYQSQGSDETHEFDIFRYYGNGNNPPQDVRSPGLPEAPRPLRPSRPASHSYQYSEDYGSPGWGPAGTSGYSIPSLSDTLIPSSGANSPTVNGYPSSYDQLPSPQYGHRGFESGTSTPRHYSNVSLSNLLPNTPPPVVSKEWVQKESIARIHDRDDVDFWNGWKRQFFRLTPLFTMLNTVVYLGYLGLRIACVIWAQQARNTVYPQAWVFIGVELLVAIPSLMHNLWTMWAAKKRRRPKLRLTSDDVPGVDVFITCCGEEDDLVMDTVRAACDLDYPRERFRVIVLDDAKSQGLEDTVRGLSKVYYPNLFYMAREKIPGKPHHFKAGNLNYGLEQTHYLPGGAAPYMAALDADMIPERDWLRAILPHLILDPKMALACPPQLFYNTPPSDPLAQSLDLFVHVIEPIKDALGVAWCTGSGYVVRREALDEIGNFPLGSLAEDVATSTLMLGKGWKTAFIHEPLQYGTVPDDFGGHIKQRTRWAIGTVDTSFKLNFCLWGDKVRQMTAAQRFSGFLYATLSLYTVLLTVSIFAIPIILVMGKPLVAFATDEQFRWLIRACFASVISNRLCEFALFIPAGYHTGQRGSRYQLWMAPYIALCIVRSFVLPKWLGGQTQAFKPTGSLGSALQERDLENRKSMFRRVWAVLINYMAAFHLAFVYLTLVGAAMTSYRCFYVDTSVVAILKCLVTHAFWPPLTFVFICSTMWTPIAYAIDPPVMPNREQLLNRDRHSGVAHPTDESKKIAFGGQAAWFEFEYTSATLYTALVFAASFIIF